MEPVLVILIVFSFSALMVKMSLDHKRAKLLHERGDGDNSLRMSELESMIQRTVGQAILPFEERLEQLESRVDEAEAQRLEATTAALLLSDASARSTE